METKQQQEVRKLELQIAINEMLPADLRCDDAIAKMKSQLARARQGSAVVIKFAKGKTI